MTYLEAIRHARSGSTVYCGGKEIRFLTFEEAEAFILEQCPSRKTIINEETGRPLIKNGKIVVETFADPKFDTKRLGLHDVSQNPPVLFVPSPAPVDASPLVA